MTRHPRHLLGASVFLAVAVTSTWVIASDHDEAETSSYNDAAADIGDVYAFHGDGRLTVILTVDGYRLRTETPDYDPDVLYGIHIDTDGDAVADRDIWARFGQNSAGDWAVQFEGVPGVEGAIVSAIEETSRDEASGAEVFAGYRDDPFFFDLDGFKDTLMTGTVQFNPERDFVALKNTVALAVEFDYAALDSDNLGVWATTGRRAQ